MNTPLVTMKTTPEALRILRLIAAYTGKKQYEVMEDVLREMWAFLQQEKESSAPRRSTTARD